MKKDNWEHRSREMRCETCMNFCNNRCRRHAPTLNGYPAVYPTDWCGDHKLDKEKMKVRDYIIFKHPSIVQAYISYNMGETWVTCPEGVK